MLFIQLLVILGVLVVVFAKSDLELPLNLTAECTVTQYSQVSAAVSSCTNIIISNLKVPANQKVNLALKDGASLTFRGTTSFDVGTLDDWLLTISGNNINVVGEKGSLIHGNGQAYWDGQGIWGGKVKPKLLNIYNVNKATFKGINLKNCPLFCTGITNANDLTIDGWKADSADGDGVNGKIVGRNTDGIGIAWSKNVVINNAFIHNQDQCLYVNQGYNMVFTNIHCVGSNGICATAGFSATDIEENTTKNITFHNCVMEGGLVGVQIIAMAKPGGGAGQVSDITFQNVVLKGVRQYGLYIQTDYGDDGHPNNNLDVRNIKFSHISGTVESKAMAVKIFCSKKCSNIQLSNVDITGSTLPNSCNYQPIGFTC